MKKRSLLPVLTALLLVLALSLQGCGLLLLPGALSLFPEELPFTSEEAFSETASPVPSPEEPVERPYEGRLEEIPFGDMPYERPDARRLVEQLQEMADYMEEAGDPQAVCSRFDPIYDDYISFSTMSTLSYIRYTLDLEDAFYDREHTWCEEQSPLVEQALEACYVAMSRSPLRGDLEEAYFGEDFFLYYDTHQFYSDDRVVALMQEEAALQTEYMALQSSITIPWEGSEVLYEELLSRPDLSQPDAWKAMGLYYEIYGPRAAGIFRELILVRREMAQLLDYPSYADLAYEFHYDRDYTPRQADAYMEAIRKALVPVYREADSYSAAGAASAGEVMGLLQEAARSFGGPIEEAYDYMLRYDLWDMTDSPTKMPGSYMTYLSAYEMPFAYISPTGDLMDFMTATHEFGHFTDAYVNCNTTTSIDCAEIFSQGLEFLVLDRTSLEPRRAEALREAKLLDSLSVYVSQACYSTFERLAYELPEEELTTEGFHALFLQCAEDFGQSVPGFEALIAPGWTDVQHFFIAPFYMISYCVSNDIALQIYQRQLETGDGYALYRQLLRHSSENTVLALVDQTDAVSPLEPARVREVRRFFLENLD